MIKNKLLTLEIPQELLEVGNTFSELEIDESLLAKGFDYRKRAFSRFYLAVENGKFQIFPLPHQPFRQSPKYNRLFADVERYFPPMKLNASEHIKFVARKLELDYHKEWECGVHQIRIMATDKSTGSPVPEGFHRDGFKFVAILVMMKKDIRGGKTTIASVKRGELLFRTTLQAGTGVVFDDVNLKHNTTDIQAKKVEGFRDVIIVTFIEWENRTFEGDFKISEQEGLELAE
jgi:hypothetical protein